MSKIDVKSLIDPQANLINRDSSTRALKLFHRCLLSHIVALGNLNRDELHFNGEEEPFDVEYNSSVQLAEELGNYLKTRKNA